MLLAAATLALCTSQSWAQTRTEADIRAQYEAERAACLRDRSGDEQAVCLKEAGAAAAAARRGALASDADRFRENALMRCLPLPPADREACRRRIEGEGTVRGSVEEGGLYRELVTREVAPAPVAAPPVVVPAPPEAPAPQYAPPPAGSQLPTTPPRTRVPGAPTFTPVQPVIPGRSAAPPTLPTAPASHGVPVAPPPESPATSLQISPPGTPVLQMPAPEAAPGTAPAPSVPAPATHAPAGGSLR